MKIPANVLASITKAATAQRESSASALAARPSDALAKVDEQAEELTTREGRLKWLRDFASGRMTFRKLHRGMQLDVPADPPLRLRAVEVMARIEGDLKDSPFAGANIDKLVLEIPSNGRTRVVEAPQLESGDEE
jgi:hypothetical protein